MPKTATPKAKAAPAVASPAATPKSAPPGSRPDAAVVERMKALGAECGQQDVTLQKERIVLDAESQSFRVSLCERIAEPTRAEATVEELWEYYQRKCITRPEIGYVMRDLKEEKARYDARKEAVQAIVQSRDEIRKQLQRLLAEEGPKLTVALDELYEPLLQGAIAAIRPFVADDAEAREIAEGTSKVADLNRVWMFWRMQGGAHAALSALGHFYNGVAQIDAPLAALSRQ